MKSIILRATFLALFFCIFQLITAQSDSTYVITSEIYDDERKFSVFLPARYSYSPDDSFMVTYVLDAQYDQFWNMAKSNIDYLVDNYRIVNTIVVGIHSKNRWCEFTPQHHNPKLRGNEDCPRADLFQKHLAEEVIPTIEKNYRIKPFRALIGHSSGAQFAVHTAFSDRADLFGAYIAISPPLSIHQNQILNDAEKILASNKPINKFLFATAGTVGYREIEFGADISKLNTIIARYPNKSLIWQKEIVDHTDHWTVVISSINEGLLALTRAVRVEEKWLTELAQKENGSLPQKIDSFYLEKNKMFGYSEIPSARYVHNIGSSQQELKHFDTGIRIMEWGESIDENEFRLPVQKGDFLLKRGRVKEAKIAFQKGLKNLDATTKGISENAKKGWRQFSEERLTSITAVEQSDQIAKKLYEKNNFPGMAVSVMRKGQHIWSGAYGYADIENKIKVDASKHMFRIGSVSKTLTASLMAQLYEEGKLDLEAEVQKYVPGFPKKKHAVKVNQVAHHVGGIRHYGPGEYLSNKHYATVGEGLEIFKNDPLINTPGTKYSYSSYGWNLLSAVCEGAGGEPFLEQMQERVFDPCGMSNTTPEYAHKEYENKVQFYNRRNESNVIAPPVDNSYKWAGGGFIGTTEDLLQFAYHVLNEDLYSKATQETFTTPFMLPDGKSTSYGLGWRTGEDKKGRKWVGHSGGSVGGTTMFLIYPKEEIVVATAVNLSSASMGDLAFRIANQFLSVFEE